MVEQVRRIYFAAESVLTALGDLSQTMEAMAQGRSGLAYRPEYDVIAGCIDRNHPMARHRDGFTRFESLVINQVEDVCKQAGVSLESPSSRLVISTTKGNVDLLAEHGLVPESYLYTSASAIASYFNACHRPIVISNACISGLSAMVVARNILLDKEVDNVVVVGCDVLSEFIVEGFRSFKSISAQPCRPYDDLRDGLSLGEACGAVVLTACREKAATSCIELCGGAVTNDANHISGPSRTGDGLFYAMDQAMKQAGIMAEQVSFVNTHGTATRYNDEMESKAVAWAGLSDTPLNAVKGYIGHTLGASGVVEAIICAQELRNDVIYGSKGFSTPGTPCPVAITPETRTGRELTCCVKTASGFGGCNAAVVLCKEGTGTAERRERTRQAAVTSEYELPQSDMPFADFIRQEFKAFDSPNMKFYKMSDLCKAVYVSVENLLAGNEGFAQAEPVRRAIVLANKVSSLESDMQHQMIVNQHNEEGASPAVFVYTLPNVAAGEMCIRHKIQGDNTFFIENSDSALAEDYARYLIETDQADAVICGWCEKLDENWDVRLKLIENIK